MPIRAWAANDRPREKMIQQGPASLSDSELIAILLQTGSAEKSALDLARELLAQCRHNLSELGRFSTTDYQRIKGVGQAKATLLAAALELGKRREASRALEKPVMSSSHAVAGYLRQVIRDYPFEVFGVLLLNQANKVLHFELVSQGGLTGTVADPRIIFKKALEYGATGVILCHNHPSGNTNPSQADKLITQKLKSAGEQLDIRVLDHVIIAESGYYSFADEGLI